MMQTLYAKYAGSLIRHGLTLAAGALVAHGLSNNDDLMKLAADLTPVLISISWSLINKYLTHQALQPSDPRFV